MSESATFDPRHFRRSLDGDELVVWKPGELVSTALASTTGILIGVAIFVTIFAAIIMWGSSDMGQHDPQLVLFIRAFDAVAYVVLVAALWWKARTHSVEIDWTKREVRVHDGRSLQVVSFDDVSAVELEDHHEHVKGSHFYWTTVLLAFAAGTKTKLLGSKSLPAAVDGRFAMQPFAEALAQALDVPWRSPGD